MSKQAVVGIDPSGSYNEGKGTTGWCVLDSEGDLAAHGIIDAKNFASQLQYWNGVIREIDELLEQNPSAALSIEDYILYAASAKAQINSSMETSKLIGAITMFAYTKGTHIFLRNASQVKNRWTNEILEHMNLIQKHGNTWADMQGNVINQHSMDAIRHAMHCYHFEIRKEKWLR